MDFERTDPSRITFTHTIEPTDDTEIMRRRAQDLYGENWAKHRFYKNAYLFTVGYLDGKAEWLSTLQQNPHWEDLGVVGFCRRSYTQIRTDNGITPGYLGDFGEPTFIAHYNRGREMGFNRFVLTSDRRSKVRSNISRLPRFEELTGVKWYTKDERYMTVPTPEYQYCIWSNEEECYFEKEN
jgi:hypothetical protein